jgi:YidC/Oxa1 family membrane protein insertase
MSANQQKNQAEQQRLQQQKNQTEQLKNDSLNNLQKKDSVAVKKHTAPVVDSSEIKNINTQDKYGMFAANSIDASKIDSANNPEKVIILENKDVILEFTNYGGMLKKYTMKDFKKWDQSDLQLINWDAGRELSLFFKSKDGKQIDTRNLIFEANYEPWKRVNLESDSTFKLQYVMALKSDSTRKIIITYTFRSSGYAFDVDYDIVKPDEFIADYKYEVVWSTSLNLSEFRSDEEATFEGAYAYMGGEITEVQATKFDKNYEEQLTGNTDYVCSRNKYFGVFIVPENAPGDGAYIKGNRVHLPNEGVRGLYTISIKKDIKSDKEEKSTFNILVTPMDYKILKTYGKELTKTMRFTLDFIVRPIAEYLILPFFNFLHGFIPNYGLVIIIFSIVLKIVLNPLTKKQTESMRKMGTLNPKMTEIREKYKDDPTKMNSMIMKLYKEEGINPMGGCLPLILQLPILYALFGVFRSTIDLRQAPFIWWITDLSSPDVIFNLPFKIPIFGISQIAGVATLMGITMFIQQKMTTTDPKQKAMVYIMPVFFTLLFYSFPSGLNLYYFIFNLLSIAQQYYNTKIKPAPVEDLNKPKKPAKKGFMERMTEYAEKQRKQQKKSGKRR